MINATKLSAKELKALSTIHTETVYTFSDYDVARGLANRLGLRSITCPSFGVYQVIVKQTVLDNTETVKTENGIDTEFRDDWLTKKNLANVLGF